MSVAMKKPPTEMETTELRLIGPALKRQEAIEALRLLGFVDVSDSVAWRECFPNLPDQEIPGRCLRGARVREGLTQRELSRLIGVPQRHLSEMENGKRPIGKEMAKRLAQALKVGYRVFL
jgi:hypothetical protein